MTQPGFGAVEGLPGCKTVRNKGAFKLAEASRCSFLKRRDLPSPGPPPRPSARAPETHRSLLHSTYLSSDSFQPHVTGQTHKNRGLHDTEACFSVMLEESAEGGAQLGLELLALGDLGAPFLAVPTGCLVAQGSSLDSTHHVHIPVEEERRKTKPYSLILRTCRVSTVLPAVHCWPQHNPKGG